MVKIDGLTSADGSDSYTFELHYSPFRIIQKVNDVVTVVVNHQDTLWFQSEGPLARTKKSAPFSDQGEKFF